MASWIDAQRPRCGPLTDAASIFASQLGVERDPPAGAAGLVALALAIRRHRDSDDDERLFVELAGSYLALVLCDSLGRGEHAQSAGRHGLDFGRQAFFDPFAAIERSLEARNVPTCLAHEVARAEAMAQGRGPDAWLALRGRVLPRLVGHRFFDELGKADVRARVLTQPLAGQVRLAFIVREHGAGRYLGVHELPEGASCKHVLAAALANLASGSKQARLVRAETDCGPLVVACTGDGLDSSRVLLPGLYHLLAQELGTPVAVALPHRDALFACRLNDAEFLVERTRVEASHARHAISSEVLVLHGPGELRVL